MVVRVFFAMLTVLLSLHALVMTTDATAANTDAAWISFSEAPIRSAKQQEFHVRATQNVAPELLKFFSAHVSRTTDLRFLLKSYSDAKLKYRSDNFLVTRIDGADVTIAIGKDFPELATVKLAKQLHAMGFRVDTVQPKALLHRNDHQDQDEPEFIVPYVTDLPR